jgi:3-phosphoshikimate 1-carboxyvinyltransferase
MKVEIVPQQSTTPERTKSIPVITLPPDKSIFHRLLIIGSLTKSKITIPIPSIEEIPADVVATILALESLGVPIEISRSKIELQGVGIHGFHVPTHHLNCANSGTTARLLMGLLSGQKFDSVLIGDASLTKRPMKRLADILNVRLGAKIRTSHLGALPVFIKGSGLHGGDIVLEVASAQMKSALMLAAFYTKDKVSIREPHQSRDHSERMLMSFGGDIKIGSDDAICVAAKSISAPEELAYYIPGDISSAAFLIAAAILTRKNIALANVGLNPTRRKFLDILVKSGLEVEITEIKEEWNESRAHIEIFAAETTISSPFEISAEDISLLIDEIPILAILSVWQHGETVFNNVSELRRKESDRITALVINLVAFGVVADERSDSFIIEGNPHFIASGGTIQHFGDHRIAMALSILALRAKEKVTISDAEIVSTSYPNFFRDLALIAGKDHIRIS